MFLLNPIHVYLFQECIYRACVSTNVNPQCLLIYSVYCVEGHTCYIPLGYNRPFLPELSSSPWLEILTVYIFSSE